MSELSVFAYESSAVRTTTLNGEPWFVATDIAKILGYKLATDMLKMLDEDEKGMHNLHIRSENGVEQMREVSIISESGLYAAILKSRRPEAKAFRKWVTAEILPSIRKTGGYGAPPTFTTANLGHGADLVVAADRTFRGILRSARSAGLRLPQALRVANRQTVARTGMDMLHELGVVPEDAQLAPNIPEDSADRFLAEWQQGRTRFPYTAAKCLDLMVAYRLWCAENGERRCDDQIFQLRYSRLPGLRKEQVRMIDESGKMDRANVIIPRGFDYDGQKGRALWRSARLFSESLGV